MQVEQLQKETLSTDPSLEMIINGITLHITESTSEELLKKCYGWLPMLNDASCFKQVYIVTWYTDLRFGIDRLAALVQSYLGDHCFEPDTI